MSIRFAIQNRPQKSLVRYLYSRSLQSQPGHAPGYIRRGQVSVGPLQVLVAAVRPSELALGSAATAIGACLAASARVRPPFWGVRPAAERPLWLILRPCGTARLAGALPRGELTFSVRYPVSYELVSSPW
jgi:hypothetical protein